MKKLAGTILAVGIAATALTTGTFSDFTSTTETHAKVDTGTVMIELNQQYPDPMFFTNTGEGFPDEWADGYWQPGKQSETKSMIIRNTGSLPVSLKTLSATVRDTNMDAATKAKFAGWLQVKITSGLPGGQPVFDGTMAQLLSGEQSMTKTLNLQPYDARLNHTLYQTPFYVQIKMSRDANNDIMGKYLKFDLNVHSVQKD
ncbi:hypothetical protein [Fictibacillus sp. FJAT-27399]|uniref:hypothetical protein n=1 Tax=Fictibacillus sp. FJAT-27399 TaxID=1729689 RepID=UPI00078196B8|nr:hypothetical protein [Fictibacillus sp. FJAT-27399]